MELMIEEASAARLGMVWFFLPPNTTPLLELPASSQWSVGFQLPVIAMDTNWTLDTGMETEACSML
eukprot:2081467-Amphidinium_carterae.1